MVIQVFRDAPTDSRLNFSARTEPGTVDSQAKLQKQWKLKGTMIFNEEGPRLNIKS